MNKILVFIFALLPFYASAALLNCGDADIERLMVQGDRDGDHGHENTLLVELSVDGSNVMCSGKNYVYIDNTDPAYTGFLSVFLAAQMSGKQVQVSVNTDNITGGNAVEIAFVSISK